MSVDTGSVNTRLFLDQLKLDSIGTIVVMLCRIWDVNATNGRYLSTDFIVSDAKVAFNHYISCCYCAKTIRRSLVISDGSIRYPFQLVELENIVPSRCSRICDKHWQDEPHENRFQESGFLPGKP